MQGLIFYSLLFGFALAGPFSTTSESPDFNPDDDDIVAAALFGDVSPTLGDRELENNEGEFVYREPMGEDTTDSDYYENVDLEGLGDFEGGDVVVGSFKFLPGGVKLFSENSGLPEPEEERWNGEPEKRLESERPADEEYNDVLSGREEDYTEFTKDEQTNGEVAIPRTIEESDREVPANSEEQAWFGDIVDLKARMAEAERLFAD